MATSREEQERQAHLLARGLAADESIAKQQAAEVVGRLRSSVAMPANITQALRDSGLREVPSEYGALVKHNGRFYG